MFENQEYPSHGQPITVHSSRRDAHYNDDNNTISLYANDYNSIPVAIFHEKFSKEIRKIIYSKKLNVQSKPLKSVIKSTNKKEFFDMIFKNAVIINANVTHLTFIFDESLIYLTFYNDYKDTFDINLSIYSQTQSELKNIIKKWNDLIKEFVSDSVNNVEITVWTSGDLGNMRFYVTEKINEIFNDLAYPYIPNVEKYISDYINGDEPLLILLGPKGTGKTKLIRNIMKHIIKSNIVIENPLGDQAFSSTFYYTFDENVLKSDQMYVNYMQETDVRGLILEDIDNFLIKREKNNNLMHKFLSLSDGLITNDQKKIIFSTNLKNINDIDPALIRAGRCYNVLETRNLTKDESANFLNSFDPSLKNGLDKNEYSLAELYSIVNGKNNCLSNNCQSSVGF